VKEYRPVLYARKFLKDPIKYVPTVFRSTERFRSAERSYWLIQIPNVQRQRCIIYSVVSQPRISQESDWERDRRAEKFEGLYGLQ
jgi:hypothetical protein